MKTMQHTLSTEQETLKFGTVLASAITSGAIIYLHGDLGVGKTTLVRGMLRGFGYQDKVKSPTYTLVEPYQLQNHAVFHFDLYRLVSPADLHQLGVQEYFTDTSITLIEWPEKAAELLPLPDLHCYLEMAGEGRLLRIEANTPRGEVILQQL